MNLSNIILRFKGKVWKPPSRYTYPLKLHWSIILFYTVLRYWFGPVSQRPTTKMWIFRGKKKVSEEILKKNTALKKGYAFSFLIFLWLQDVNNCFAMFLTSLKVAYENLPVTTDPQYDASLATLHPPGCG